MMLKVRNKTLILIAGVVWLIAGFNIARLGLLAYRENLSALYVFLSFVVFLLFKSMFIKMSRKHIKRILNYETEKQSIYRFFDLKAYCIMAFMMTFGIWLRYSGLVPLWFIAFFYTSLGLALAFAGVYFVVEYIKRNIII